MEDRSTSPLDCEVAEPRPPEDSLRVVKNTVEAQKEYIEQGLRSGAQRLAELALRTAFSAMRTAEMELARATATWPEREDIHAFIEHEIAVLDRRQRLLLSVYRDLVHVDRCLREERAVTAAMAPSARHRRSKPHSKANRVRDRAAEILRADGPMHRTALTERLVEEGLLGSEAKPLNRLATILSESGFLFRSDGRGTYSLADGRISLPPPGGGPQGHGGHEPHDTAASLNTQQRMNGHGPRS